MTKIRMVELGRVSGFLPRYISTIRLYSG